MDVNGCKWMCDVWIYVHSYPLTLKRSLHFFTSFSWTPPAFVAGTAGAGGGAIAASPSGKAFNHLTMRHFTVHEKQHVYIMRTFTSPVFPCFVQNVFQK